MVCRLEICRIESCSRKPSVCTLCAALLSSKRVIVSELSSILRENVDA